MKKLLLISLLFLFSAGAVFSQQRGAIFDDEVYDNLPRIAPLSTRSYEGLPGSFSLKQFAPLPGDQTNYGTCVGWAAAYAARTISESIALNRLNQTETTQNAFSPIYIYRNIRPDDPYGIFGARIHTALDYMRDIGAVRMLEDEHTMSFLRIQLSLFKNSRYYPIGDYLTLFSRDDRQKPALITRIVKKSLTEGRPVIIGMNTPDSFNTAEGVWRPRENPDFFYYGHALCVVGYDDSRYGGAFEVMNSWGRKWGNGGFMWIPYDVFVDFVIEGYVIIENIAGLSDTIRFDGFMQIEIINPDTAAENVSFALTSAGYYRVMETLPGNTQYRLILGAGESAYVYTFSVSQSAGSENFYAPVLLFPQPRVSALMNFSGSTIILPAEETTFSLQEQAGTQYLITLYSKQALDIQDIMRRFSAAEGTINKRLVAAVDNLVTTLVFSEDEAAFTLMPDNLRAVAALITAIEHR